MTDLGPWMITAHNKEHAEYLVRSRAEQRGVHISQVEVAGGQGGMWEVSAVIEDPAEVGEAARLGEDTQALHIGTHGDSQHGPPTH
jgi:hypothetical protein